MRILAVDYGERRTGIAISDELGITAQGLKTIEVKDESEIPSLVAHIVSDKKAEKIVVGLPLNMDSSESEKCVKVREFGALLAEKTNIPVVFWDERLTSVQARRVMHELKIKTYRNKQMVDTISATLILQEYLKTI